MAAASVTFYILAVALSRVCVVQGKRPRPLSVIRPLRSVVEVRRLEACNDSSNAVTFSNVRMRMAGRADFLVDEDAWVSRTGKALEEVEFVLTKCREAVTANSCEYYETWRFKEKLCEQFANPRMPWNAFLKGVTPTPGCPTEKGLYLIRNASLDSKVLQLLFPLEGNILVARTTLREVGGVTWGCSVCEIRTHHVRN